MEHSWNGRISEELHSPCQNGLLEDDPEDDPFWDRASFRLHGWFCACTRLRLFSTRFEEQTTQKDASSQESPNDTFQALKV